MDLVELTPLLFLLKQHGVKWTTCKHWLDMCFLPLPRAMLELVLYNAPSATRPALTRSHKRHGLQLSHQAATATCLYVITKRRTSQSPHSEVVASNSNPSLFLCWTEGHPVLGSHKSYHLQIFIIPKSD